MATMKDIAKLAGVSQGTVSNVLNGHCHVSTEKMTAVLEAAKALGYQRNSQAQQLRKNSVLSSQVAVILPNIDEQQYSDFYTVIRDHFQEQGMMVSGFTTEDQPENERRVLRQLATVRPTYVFTISCLEEDDGHYADLKAIGTTLVFAGHTPDYAQDWVTFDCIRDARKIGEHIVAQSPKRVHILAIQHIFPRDRQFLDLLLSILQLNGIPCNYDTANTATCYPVAFDLISREQPEVLLCMAPYLSRSAKLACEVLDSPCKLYHFAYGLRLPGQNEHNYYYNYGQLARESLRVAQTRKQSPQAPAQRVFLSADGFLPPHIAPEIHRDCTLQMLSIKSDANDALRRMSAGFTKKTGIGLNIVTLPPNELDEILSQTAPGILQDFDLLRIGRPDNVGLHQWLHPLDADCHRHLTHTMFPEAVAALSQWDKGVPYAVPFDVGTQLLVYRQDLFEDPMVKRRYYEQYRTQLCPPKDYQDFNQVAAFFTRTLNLHSPVDYGTSLPLGANINILAHFLLRYDFYLRQSALPEGGHFDLDAARQAIENLCQLSAFSTRSSESREIGADVTGAFARGEVAMIIGHSNHSNQLLDIVKNSHTGRIGFSSVPGGSCILGGASLAITRNTRDFEAALECIHWFCGWEQANLFCLLGGSTPHQAAYLDPRLVRHFPWHAQFGKSHFSPRMNQLYREYSIPLLSSVIGSAVRNTILGAITIQDCMQQLAKQLPQCRIH